tara:strand:- start:113 stop:973 length:861 start_codon:yes stop_codon:yes gene_type:complete
VRKIIIILIIAIISLIAAFFYQSNKIKESHQVSLRQLEEKNILRDELDDLIDQHDNLLNDYGELNTTLEEKDSIIQNQISEIRNLIRVKNDLQEARKKINLLKEISKRYIADVDSLLVLNKTLVNEKDSVIKVNKDINWKNYKLNKENKKLSEKVNEGSVLEVFDLKVQGYRFRKTGVEIETSSAKKVQNLRVCFTVSANSIANKEKKEIFFQYINEQGQVLNSKDSIDVEEIKQAYTFKSFIEYENIEIEECVDWERVSILRPGVYQLNVIIDNKVSGQTAFLLK